jgi:hypothetical protein
LLKFFNYNSIVNLFNFLLNFQNYYFSSQTIEKSNFDQTTIEQKNENLNDYFTISEYIEPDMDWTNQFVDSMSVSNMDKDILDNQNEKANFDFDELRR